MIKIFQYKNCLKFKYILVLFSKKYNIKQINKQFYILYVQGLVKEANAIINDKI